MLKCDHPGSPSKVGDPFLFVYTNLMDIMKDNPYRVILNEDIIIDFFEETDGPVFLCHTDKSLYFTEREWKTLVTYIKEKC